jgi:hypothetical protein
MTLKVGYYDFFRFPASSAFEQYCICGGYPHIPGATDPGTRKTRQKFKKLPKIKEKFLCDYVGIFIGFPLQPIHPYRFRTPGTPGSRSGYPGASRVPDPHMMYTVRSGSLGGIDWSLPIPDPTSLRRNMIENVIRYNGN